MDNVNDEHENINFKAHYHKIKLLFCFLSVHAQQIMALTEQYVDSLNNSDDQSVSNKARFFHLIEVKADYAECIDELRAALNDEFMALEQDKIAYLRHHLVIQITQEIKAAKRWSRLLLMHQPGSDDKFINLWRKSMVQFEQMSYLN